MNMAKTSKRPTSTKSTSTKKRAAAKKKTTHTKAAKKPAKRAATKSKSKKTAKPVKQKKTTAKKKPAKARKVVKRAKPMKKKSVRSKSAKQPKKKPGKHVAGGVVIGIAPYKQKKTEKYMSKAMREHFRIILVTWKQQLMKEVDRTVSHLQGEAANFPDPSDRATQEEVFSLELRTRDRERKLIRKIEEALQVIDNEEYGYCTCCGEEIGLRRLEARPTAQLCIDCKTLDEIREKQEGI